MAPGKDVLSQLAVAVESRGRYFTRLQRCYDIMNDETKKPEFLQRCLLLSDTLEKFDQSLELIAKLNAMLPEGEKPVDNSAPQESFESMYFRVKAKESVMRAHQNQTQEKALEPVQKIKLPTLTIPQFNGEISQFPSWKSLFDELIHSRKDLSDIQKFSYLRAFVEGAASSCLDAISFEAVNYPLAYQTLVERYSKKRILASAQLNKLLKFQPLTSDNVNNLHKFLDIFQVSVQALHLININNLGEFILLHLGLCALDPETKLAFETEYRSVEFPTFDNLINFVKHKCSVLELADSANHHKFPPKKSLLTSTSLTVDKSTNNQKDKKLSNKCAVCHQGTHKLLLCPKFQKMEPSNRYTTVKDLNLCFNCLSSTHSRWECTSKFQCRSCGSSSHHTMLHPVKVVTSGDGKMVTKETTPALCGKVEIHQPSTVLLGTAVVRVRGPSGEWYPSRCVVDPGSQISAISENLVQILNLPRKKCHMEIAGIGSGSISTRGEVLVNILPHSQVAYDGEPMRVGAVVLSKISSELPSKIPPEILAKFSHLQLADLSYLSNQSSSRVDILLGAEHYSNLLLTTLPIIQGYPAAIPSKLGWLLMGRIDASYVDGKPKFTSLFISSQDPVVEQLQRFWEIEDCPTDSKPTDPEAEFCEHHFQQTHQRDASGRYIVRLPFKNGSVPVLGSTRFQAENRLHSLERKLLKNSKFNELYCENLQDYLDCNHMEIATKPSNYILTHHGVFRETASTTKMRVVFDPNVKADNSVSLCEALAIGPKLQTDISDILVRFRLHPVALTCDIQGMYRSIWLHPDDRLYQHILWRFHPNDKICEYELKTVTFGLPPSPFQAQRVIQQLSIDEGKFFPRTKFVLENDIYVDDVVTGGESVEDAINLRNQLIALFQRGGFHVRKWASSHADVIQDLAEDLCEKPHACGSGESIKILGIQWCPKSDSFFYSVSVQDTSGLSKRKVLSLLATIYDLNGFLSPVTVWLKIFLQELWLNRGLSWDTPLPESLQGKLSKFLSEIPLISQIHIPRYISSGSFISMDLVGFADASRSAYAGVFYAIITQQNGEKISHLIRAKTKVAPLKVQSIPRLELCAALLLARVLRSLAFLRLRVNNVYLFSDSTVVLAWLKTAPHRLKTYVANRIVQILDLTKSCQWRHVSTELNPADCASRGFLPSQLVKNKLWFHGPAFLVAQIEDWPGNIYQEPPQLPELKATPKAVLKVSVTPEPLLIKMFDRFSSLVTLERVMALVLRFIFNLRNPQDRLSGFLSVKELNNARVRCIKLSQNHHFCQKIKQIRKGVECSNPSLATLSPIINSEGLLVVGGRLANSPLPESAKHPILIPNKCSLAKLLVSHFHLVSIHGGPKLVQGLIQRYYWIIGARALIRKVIHKCLSCFKGKVKCLQPVMADIPISRFRQGRPFLNVGVDLAGPFPLKTGPRRNSPIEKSYFAIFVCMTTKCVHLELVTSLSTPTFLAALDRFIARRGRPSCLFSDNATNFRGSEKFWKESGDSVQQHLTKHEIKWSFIPPSAPNFGGLWEAGVKSVKSHLNHVIHDRAFTYEEFNSLLIQVEAILNSRPLCCLRSSPDDGVDVLTPGHFLTGAPLLARPEPDLLDHNSSYLSRWQLISHANQCFWKRFNNNYVNSLIQRSKWTTQSKNLKVGDVVLVQGQNMPPRKWPLGVVIRVLPGADGVVRVAVIKTSQGECIRPVNKLALLPHQT